MDALKDRVGAITEGILIMTCPVLAAVALKKVDLRSPGDAAVRGSVSPLAAISLFLCSLAFVLLGMASAFKDWLPHELMFRFSKLLVHLCAIFQMLLAYMILLLIAMKFEASMALLIVFAPFIILCGYQSVVRSNEKSERAEADVSCDKDLDFGALTGILRGRDVSPLPRPGRLGVGGPDRRGGVGGQDLSPHLLAPLGLTFVFCVVATAVMLIAAVPPIVDYTQVQQCTRMSNVLHALCGALTLFFTAVVLAIVFVLERENGVPVAVVPCLVLFFSYVICLFLPGGTEPAVGHQVTPASLEMTKVAFTGFLAISLPSFRDESLSMNTRAFIICTAMTVLFGLSWRFLTHFKQQVAVWTAKVASVLTYCCLGAAAFPFMLMAMKALADNADEECHIPCNSGPSAQLQLFITCFNKIARGTSSYVLSSVNC